MIVAYSYVPVSDAAAGQAFADAMADRSHEVERFPGFVRFEFRRETGRAGRYVIATWWESRADLRRYLRSDVHMRTHGRLQPWVQQGLGPARVEIHDVVEVSSG